jgi:3-deoxy-D-manno-octulosonate 8-phosphate phosphatase (KDO 8-P phosphatase)
MDKNLTAKLKKIKILVSDVDGVLTDGGAYYSDEGIELKKFNIRDGMGFVLLQKAGFRVAIVTTEKTKIVERRSERLKVNDLYQGVVNKVAAVEELMKKYSLTWQEVAFIGDDINDIPVLKKVGFAATPSNGMPINKKLADYVCQCEGGHGAVREVCDLLLELNWKGEAIADLWLKQ